MRTIGWMLTRMVVMRFIMLMFGICAFFITLDVFTYADDVLALNGGRLGALGTYAFLLLPSAASTFLAMCVLLSLLLTLIELSYRSETVALWASGIPPFRILIMLLPLGALLGGVNFLINDQAVTRASPVLHNWGIGDYGKKQLKVGEQDLIWMRAENDILRAVGSNPQATELTNVTIFRRDQKGLLTEQIMADSAVLMNDRWKLSDVVIYYQENLLPNRVKTLIYSNALRPAPIGARSGDPEEMSLNDLEYFIVNSGFGIRPAHVYQTWWHKRISLLTSAWLMIALCLPLAVRYRRGGGIAVILGFGIAIGFSFFIFDGISLTIGELGIVPPWMAAWTPVLVFSGLAASLMLRAETVS
ncbi:MAG: LptF/LptG family permease [Rhizobiales bacterium]|nr:LptF/LptG family permease [Hyphomicrobiales bacterium]